jgi:HK97 gp10 family phage protein
MMTEVLQGLQELEKKLSKLGELEARKALNQGITKGGAVIRKAARANAKRLDNELTTEQIFENVTAKKWLVKKGRKYLGVSVGINKNGKGGDTYYWRFLEFGTSKMAAKPFLEPALEQARGAAIEAVKAGAIQAIKDSAK